MTRQEIQDQAVKLSSLHKYLILEFGTSIGKTLCAIRIIELNEGFWNIIIAETTHELNWIEEFKKHGKEKLLNRVKFSCYQSLHKYLNCENYIFDELHHAFSDKRIDLLNQINYNRFIGLSATLTRTQKDTLKSIIGEYCLYKVSLSEAIDANILPEPSIYFIGIDLDNTIKNHKFNFNQDKYVMCTEKEMYDRLSQRIEWLKDKYFKSQVQFDKVKWLKSANDRKKFLSNCKTRPAKIVLERLKHKRIICFTGSIEQSEELSNGYSIHSKLSKSAIEKLISDFNNGTINKLFCTKMLKEGVNLSNIEVGLITTLDNVERYLIQVLGRTMRSLSPLQYVLYVKNTQDQVYVKNVLENFNMDYVKFIPLENLTIS